jgi:hypothetical protein
VEAFEIAGGTSGGGGAQSNPAEGHQARQQAWVQADRSAEYKGAQLGEGEHSVARVWLLKPLPQAVRDWLTVFFPIVQIALVLLGQLLTTPGETIQIQNVTIYPARQPYVFTPSPSDEWATTARKNWRNGNQWPSVGDN